MKLMDLGEFRCKWCGRLLSKICIEKGRIEIKCPNKNCKRNKDGGINSFEFGYEGVETRPEEERTDVVSNNKQKL